MKAACPHCFDNTISKAHGCEKCQQTGFIDMQFAKGALYEPRCRLCGAEGFGMHISEDGKSPTMDDVEDACCIACSSHNLEWILVGYSQGG